MVKKLLTRWWIGTAVKDPNLPLIRPTISWTWLVSFWSARENRWDIKYRIWLLSWMTELKNIHSGTSVLVGTAIWSKTTLSHQYGFSSRNFSNANIFWGIPFIISRRSTPSITCNNLSLLHQTESSLRITIVADRARVENKPFFQKISLWVL